MKSKTRLNHFFTLLLVIILIITLASACNTNTTPTNQENSNPTFNNDNNNDQPPSTEPPATEPPPVEHPPTEPPDTEPSDTEPPADSPTIPTADLSTTGPWIVFPGEENLWALNRDGSGVTLLVNFNIPSGVHIFKKAWAAPRGGRVAVLLIDDTFESTIPRILIINIPSGTIEADIQTLPPDWDLESFTDRYEKDAANQLFAAVGVWNELAWSHDGTMLAFSAAIDGPTSDLYVYNTTDKSILRLTSGSSESVDPFFTIPDSHIVHGAVSHLYYEYSGSGYDYLDVWAARPDGSGVNKVFNHEFLGFENFLGWTGYLSYLGDSWEMWCNSFNLRNIDINDGVIETLYEGHYSERAFADNYELFLFAIPNNLQDNDCISGYDPGVYMMDTSTGDSTKIPGIQADDVTDITWQERSELFFVITYEGIMYSVSTSGSVTEYQVPQSVWNPPIFSLDGTKWVFINNSEDILVIGGLNGEYITLNVESPRNPIWSPDSQWLVVFANGLNIYAAPAPNYEPLVAGSDYLDFVFGGRPVIVNP